MASFNTIFRNCDPMDAQCFMALLPSPKNGSFCSLKIIHLHMNIWRSIPSSHPKPPRAALLLLLESLLVLVVCLHFPWEHPPDCVEAIHWAWEVSFKPEWMVLFRSSMCFLFLLVQQYNYDKDWGVCQHSINWDGKSPQEKPVGVHSFPRGQLQGPAVNSCNVCTQQRIRKGRVVQMRRQAVARRWSTLYYYVYQS